jgi:hypothetical protein
MLSVASIPHFGVKHDEAIAAILSAIRQLPAPFVYGYGFLRRSSASLSCCAGVSRFLMRTSSEKGDSCVVASIAATHMLDSGLG